MCAVLLKLRLQTAQRCGEWGFKIGSREGLVGRRPVMLFFIIPHVHEHVFVYACMYLGMYVCMYARMCC